MSDREPRGLDLTLVRRLGAFLRKHRLLMAVAVVAMVVTNLLQVVQPFLVKVGIDRDVANGDLVGLARTATLLAAALLAHTVSQVGFTYAVEYLGQRLLYDLRMRLFDKVLRLGQAYFDRTPVGATLTNVTNDVEAIRQFISQGVVSLIGDTMLVLVILGAMLWINVGLALVTFLTLPFFAIVSWMFRSSIRGGYRDARVANAQINTTLVEAVTGIREVTLLNYQGRSLVTFAKHNGGYRDAYLRLVHTYSYYFPAIELLATAGYLIILGYSHYVVGTGVRAGEIFAFFSYVGMLYRPLRQLAERFNTFQAAMAAAERIFKLLDRQEEIRSPRAPAPDQPAELVAPERSTDAARGVQIELRRVDFAYEPNAPVLQGMQLRIAPGERVGLVGTTGSGKTTIINLINRLYDVQAGAVLLDGHDVRELSVAEHRAMIATVPQDLFLFSGSIAENISLGKPGFSRVDIEGAAAAVNADRFIRRLADGYDQDVLEEGKALSTGEKQLLSFARAFLLDPRLVVMDEATASVDAESEHLIEGALSRLFAGRTAIIIAHRLSTIRRVDRILVLHRGQVVEEGTHDALLERNGRYAQLYRLQLLAAESSIDSDAAHA